MGCLHTKGSKEGRKYQEEEENEDQRRILGTRRRRSTQRTIIENISNEECVPKRLPGLCRDGCLWTIQDQRLLQDGYFPSLPDTAYHRSLGQDEIWLLPSLISSTQRLKIIVHAAGRCWTEHLHNNWSNIHDFTPVEGETNWSCSSQSDALEQAFKLPETEELKSVELMLGTETSVVPFTLGSPMYGGQEATLVIFFFDETYQQKAMDFISSLKSKIQSCRIQHSREVKMEISDAQRVFQTSQYKSAISRGPSLHYCVSAVGYQKHVARSGRN
nr:uncharacterized protein LOC113813564 [Penaeus vannamei]